MEHGSLHFITQELAGSYKTKTGFARCKKPLLTELRSGFIVKQAIRDI